MWDFFSRKICLTARDDEYQIAQQEFARVGLTVDKFQALPIEGPEILGPHQSFNGSMNRILREFVESDAQTLLIVEDDCVFKPLDHLQQAIGELPGNWDILYLGANLQAPPVRYSPHLCKVTGAWTTHAIAFSRNVVPWILEKQPGFSECMFDTWLSANLKSFRSFIISPMVAYQRARFSSIWLREDDYTPIFEQSDAMLRECR